ACAAVLPAVLAAERAYAERGRAFEPGDVASITVEINADAARRRAGTGMPPDTRETADHDLRYVVAAVLLDGRLDYGQFDDAHLRDQRLHALLERTTVVANADFTRRYEQVGPR